MLIHEYTNKWASDFLQIKTLLIDALAGLSVSIEHVGSTAVPGLAAKPIIDIDIIFNNKNDFDNIKNGLERIGYYHNGDQGIKDREVFKRSSPNEAGLLNEITHHLYVCPADSWELQRHLLFRNYLIANAEARNKYQQIKLQLAEEANQQRKIYAQLKEEKANVFIDEIVGKAARLRV